MNMDIPFSFGFWSICESDEKTKNSLRYLTIQLCSKSNNVSFLDRATGIEVPSSNTK